MKKLNVCVSLNVLVLTSDLTAHPEAEALVLSRDTTDHSHRADAQGFAKLDGLLFDLLGQLTSGRQNHSVRALVRVLNSTEKTSKTD